MVRRLFAGPAQDGEGAADDALVVQFGHGLGEEEGHQGRVARDFEHVDVAGEQAFEQGQDAGGADVAACHMQDDATRHGLLKDRRALLAVPHVLGIQSTQFACNLAVEVRARQGHGEARQFELDHLPGEADLLGQGVEHPLARGEAGIGPGPATRSSRPNSASIGKAGRAACRVRASVMTAWMSLWVRSPVCWRPKR